MLYSMCFYNSTIHIVEMFYDKNCQVYNVYIVRQCVFVWGYCNTVKKFVLWQNKLSKVWCLKSFILDDKITHSESK